MMAKASAHPGRPSWDGMERFISASQARSPPFMPSTPMAPESGFFPRRIHKDQSVDLASALTGTFMRPLTLADRSARSHSHRTGCCAGIISGNRAWPTLAKSAEKWSLAGEMSIILRLTMAMSMDSTSPKARNDFTHTSARLFRPRPPETGPSTSRPDSG